MKLNFISGLPRSGSTLFGAVLNQDPRCTGGMTGPVWRVFKGLEDSMSAQNETGVFVTDRYREAMLRASFTEHYENPTEFVFDTARFWCARWPLLAKLFPDAKMVCCVREIGWVLDSFERLYRRNGMKPSAVFGWDTNGTIWSRMSQIAQGGGVVGYSINALREALASDEAVDRIMLVDYEDLCRVPAKTMRSVYDFIGIPRFKHNFSNVSHEAGEFDRLLGADGMHTVSGKIEWRPRRTILPQELFDEYNGPNFWRKP